MKVISVLNPKGGVGKSTIAINLARGIQLRNNSVLVIDTDFDQTSIFLWGENTDESFFDVLQCKPERIETAISKHKHYDYIIIDNAGKVEFAAIKVMQMSDMVIVPIQPSPFDLWGSITIIDVVKALKKAPPTFFLISRAKKGTKVINSIKRALKPIGIPVFNTVIHDRVDYVESAILNQTIFELNDEGAAEVNKLIDQVLEVID